MWVAHARRAGMVLASELGKVASQGEPLRVEETIAITPFAWTTPVSGLLFRSFEIERVRRPSGVVRQPQHSFSCWSLANTYTRAHRLPSPAVPGLVIRTVPSGAPATPLLAK